MMVNEYKTDADASSSNQVNINSFLIGYIWHYFRAWISQTNLYYYVDIYVYNSVSLPCNATLKPRYSK